MPVYRFDRFELDSERRELRCEGAPVPVQPRPLDLLLYLARNHERVVPRGELLDALWSGVQVNDEALTFAVHQARRAVGDDGTHQAVIRTISRNGFRFVASLASQEDLDGSGDATSFIGRSETLEAIEAALRDAVAGTRSLILLSGEAGIGKTRTAERAAEVARRRGFQVLLARCVEAEGAPVYWPWIQLLRPLVKAVPAEELASVLGQGGPELARLLPEIRERWPDLPEAGRPEAQAARFLLFDSATALVRRAAETRPILLVIDDLHRADLSSLTLLRDLTRQLAGTRVVLLGTHREAELGQDAQRAARVAELVRERGTRLLTLSGFSEDEVGEFLRATTGQVSSAVVRADLRERTNGNPFFLHQVVHVLESEQRLHEVARSARLLVELPRHSQEAVAQQVAELPEAVVAMLEVAAVIGRDIDPHTLGVATGDTGEALLRLLDAATQARILDRFPVAASSYRFRHVLLRDVLYQRLPPERRAQLHAKVGRALLRLEEEEGRPTDPPTVAHHLFEAARMGDASEALEFAVRAGRWAEERLAFEEAVASFERALDLCDRMTAPPQRQRCEILLALGDAYTKAGDRDAARRCFQSVARVAKFKGLPEELAAAALRFAPDFLAIETGVYDAELVSLLEEALAALSKVDSGVRARLLARLAVALHWAPASESRRRSLCEDADGIAARLDDPATLRYVRCARELALYSIEDPERHLQLDTSVQPVGEDAPIVLLEQLLRMTSLLQLGRLQEYREGIEVFTGLVQRLRQPQALWYCDLFRATLANLEGRLDDAEIYARRFYEEGERVKDRNAMHSFQIQMFMTAVDRGPLEPFEVPLQNLVSQFPELIGWRSALAMFYAEIGDADRARSEIDRILNLRIGVALKRNEWFAAVAAMGMAAASIGHVSGAELAHRLMEPHANEMIVVGYSSYCWSSAALMLGVTAMAMGRIEEAREHISKAVASNRRLGAWPALARSRFHEAHASIACGEVKAASEAMGEAMRLAGDLGMSRLSAKIDVLEASRPAGR